MKVSELIEKLKEMNQDLFVYVPKANNDSPEFQQVGIVKDDELTTMETEMELVCVIIQ